MGDFPPYERKSPFSGAITLLAFMVALPFIGCVPAFFAQRAFAVFGVDTVFVASSGRAFALDAKLPRSRIVAGVPSFVLILVESASNSAGPSVG